MNTQTKAFVYSVYNGEFIVQEGFVYTAKAIFFDDLISSFSKEGYDINDPSVPDRINKNYQIDNYRSIVHTNPGVLYNGVIWFEERKDTEAVDILLRSEQKKFTHLQKKIEMIESNIKALQNSMLKEKLNEF